MARTAASLFGQSAEPRRPKRCAELPNYMSPSHWTFLDFVFLVILLLSTGFALLKGLAREVISLVSLLGGFFLAAFYYSWPAGWFMSLTKTEAVANLIGFLTIFLFCLLAGAAAAFLVNRFIKMASLQWIDRLLGAVFGILRGWAIASVIALALIAFPVGEGKMVQSVFAPYLAAGARAAVLLVPQELRLKFEMEYQKILQAWNQDRSSV